MSSSQSLTTTESLGFRALIAVIGWIIAAIGVVGHGLRNLPCGDGKLFDFGRAPQNQATGSRVERLSSLMESVICFGTMGERYGPDPWRCPQRSWISGRAHLHCSADPLAPQAREAGRGAPAGLNCT
jgi:hypothetical protein